MQQDSKKLIHNYYFGKSYPPLEFLFSHNMRDFVVEEIPLYEFSNNGEHQILKIRKKNLSTHELISLVAKALNIRPRDIGYAGLKDKAALSYQYISVPFVAFKGCENRLNLLENIKIIESSRHNNKLKIGHLKGNKFFIRLKKVDNFNFMRLKQELESAKNYGFPNFFGYQRFGNFGDNFLEALKISTPYKKQNAKQKLLISSLQSYLFNMWLEMRLKISNIIRSFGVKEAREVLFSEYKISLDSKILGVLKGFDIPLLPLCGDVAMHYPFGKLFFIESSAFIADLERVAKGEVAITGLLSGINCGGNLDFMKLDSIKSLDFIFANCLKNNSRHAESQAKHLKSNKDSKNSADMQKVWLSKDIAGQIERHFSFNIQAIGTRRYAWVYPSDVEIKYDKINNHALLNFTLPSGAYATTLLSYIKNAPLIP